MGHSEISTVKYVYNVDNTKNFQFWLLVLSE
jgi:hypothetical protein